MPETAVVHRQAGVIPTLESLKPRQKAAVLLLAIGPEAAARVLQHLSESEIEQISLEIATIGHVPAEVREAVLQEFRENLLANQYLTEGGLEYARRLLEKAVGPQKALDILDRLSASIQVRPFDFLRRSDPAQLLNFLQNEHPQTIALILAHLHPDQAALVLSSLPAERQVDVVRRIATMDRTSPEIVREVERLLERRFAALVGQDFAHTGGIDSVVEVLTRVDRSTERSILEALRVGDPDLADQIKQRMFVFEDIVQLDDRSVQRVLREVDFNEVLPLALKTASEDVREKIFRNISKRAADMLRENIEFLGPVRLREVEEAQQRIVAVVRRLDEEGEIVVSRGRGDDILV